MMRFFTLFSIGIDSFKDCIYWWNYQGDLSTYAAFWIELNCGWYQLHPEIYRKDYLGAGFADVVYAGGTYGQK